MGRLAYSACCFAGFPCAANNLEIAFATLVNDAHIIVGILAIGGLGNNKVAGVIHIFANKGKLLGSLRIAERPKRKTGAAAKKNFSFQISPEMFGFGWGYSNLGRNGAKP